MNWDEMEYLERDGLRCHKILERDGRIAVSHNEALSRKWGGGKSTKGGAN